MGPKEVSTASQQLLQAVKKRTGVNLSECFQCRKCSAGCTLVGKTDILPHVLVRMVQLGLTNEVLKSQTLWLCVSCQTCTTRCPNSIDLGTAIDALRLIALEGQSEVAEPNIVTFHEVTLDTIRRHGRMFELGMIARLKLRTRDYTKDAGMGLAMMRRGKIKLLATNVKARDDITALFERSRKRG